MYSSPSIERLRNSVASPGRRAEAKQFHLAQQAGPLGETEEVLGRLQVAPGRPPAEGLESDDLAFRKPHDGLEERADGSLAEDPPHLVETGLIEGLPTAVEVLARLEDPIVNGAFEAQGRPHLDHALPDPDRDLFAVAGLVRNRNAFDQNVVKPTRLEAVTEDHQEDISTHMLLAQEAARTSGRLEQTAEVSRHVLEHCVVALPADDALQILLVLDADQEHLQNASLIEHPPHPVQHHR
jgi:hypothetical protein